MAGHWMAASKDPSRGNLKKAQQRAAEMDSAMGLRMERLRVQLMALPMVAGMGYPSWEQQKDCLREV